MKFCISILTSLLVLTLAHAALAKEHGATESPAEAEEAKKVEEMRALFPPKQPAHERAHVPGKTTLEAPAFFEKVASNQVALKWKPVEGADQYHLQIATDPNFKWLVTNEYTLKDTTFQVANLETGKHYYWRVNAVKEDNEPTHRKSGFVTSMFETVSK